jgi:cyclomaltodextrinase / maltogenic alpha-amylase / neopullulanase
MTDPANTIWWHVYPLGFCGAPIRDGGFTMDDEPTPRLRRLINWLDYVVELGCTGLILGPIFASQSHGYDTLDQYRIDPRLGTMSDFENLVAACHQRNLRIILDGVFSHVSENHPWLRNDIENGNTDSDLFDIDWNAAGGPKPRVWEGHHSLARFNHASDAAINYAIDVMKFWLAKGIDGWRLDAAYSVSSTFWAKVLAAVRAEFPQAWFLGEVIHGDYAKFVSESTVDTATEYELWKSIWSSLKDDNLFELKWTMERHNDQLAHFIPQTFVGNHDVTRITSTVSPEKALAAITVLMTVGGTPSIYAGDEVGMLGIKENRLGGDDAVRPEFLDNPVDLDHNSEPAARIYQAHQQLIKLRKDHLWLTKARTSVNLLENRRLGYRTYSPDDPSLYLDVLIDLDAMKFSVNNPDQTCAWASEN